MQRPPDEPQSLFEWLWRLKRYESGIYVRQLGPDGKWGTASLAELDPKTWAEKVAGFLEHGTLPVRVKEPEELSDDPSSEEQTTPARPADQEAGR